MLFSNNAQLKDAIDEDFYALAAQRSPLLK
jgi:hypothetical protein